MDLGSKTPSASTQSLTSHVLMVLSREHVVSSVGAVEDQSMP